MSCQVGHHHEDRSLVQQCLAGDTLALGQFRQNYLEPLRQALANRGASATQADDLTSDLWADCVVGREGRGPLLEKYNGQSSLKTWLFRVGLNAWIDQLRRESKKTELAPASREEGAVDPWAQLPAPGTPAPESALLDLLRLSLRSAFDQCRADALLRLRLVYLHGLSQREVSRMWGCHEARTSRELSEAMERIAEHTLEKVRQADPRLHLTWDDFVELCQAQLLDFV